MKIIKFVDLVSVENCIFIKTCFSCKSYSVFSRLCNLATGRHNHQTRFAMNGLLLLPNCNTVKFGTKDFLYSKTAFMYVCMYRYICISFYMCIYSNFLGKYYKSSKNLYLYLFISF